MSRPVKVTSQTIERNIKLQRDLDVKARELAAFGKETASLISANNAQTKIESQRRLAKQQICRSEQQFEESNRKAERDKKYRELTISQNQALSAELDKDAADDERRRREIQKICEDSPELRDLQKVLDVAYLNRDRAAQYEEKIALATREQERIQAIEDLMESERVKNIRAESDKDKEKKKQFEGQRAVLQKQINEKRAQLDEAKKQMEKEREMVDAIVQKINREDERDYEKRKEKQKNTAIMMEHFAEERRRELQAAKAAAQAEEERIMAYNKAVEARSEGQAAKKAAKKEEEDRILAQIVEETERKRRAQAEFDDLRDMLWEEELELKRAEDAKYREEKQAKMREEMMEANANIMVAKQIQRERERDKEARLVNAMRLKFAEDEAKERADEEARRRAKMHHMSLVEHQRLERKSMYEQERDAEAAARAEAAEKEEYRLRVIKEARARLLAQHADKLKEYMPAKAFDSKDEFNSFQQKLLNSGRGQQY